MAANREFFVRRNPQAVLKHGVLTRYAYYFAARAGRAAHGQVAFIDGYAGQGRYEDGSPGSPLLLASEAQRAETFNRKVVLALVEQDDERRAQLAESLEREGIEADQLLGESFDDVIDLLLVRYQHHATFVFVDPFGLGIDRATLERILQARTGGRPVDVLLHFSLSAVARMGALGISSKAHSEKNAARLDHSLGDVPWRDAFESATGDTAATNAAVAIAELFGKAVFDATRVPNTAIAVRQQPTHAPKYLMMLFSADAKAHWDFADQAGLAYVDWLHHCSTEDYRANVERQEQLGVIPLIPDDEPDRTKVDERVAAEAAAFLTDHVRALLMSQKAVRPVESISALYDSQLGRARAMHLRRAFVALRDAGLVDDHLKNEWYRRVIRWTGDP